MPSIPLKLDDSATGTGVLSESSPERPCTPRKRLQLAQEQDRQTSQRFTRDASVRDFSTSFVGSLLQSAVVSPRAGKS